MIITDEARGPVHELTKKHGLGAIVPLFPHSQTARSWLVFGETFGQRIHTPADFETIEQVIKQLAGLFLDCLLRKTHSPEDRPELSPNAPAKSHGNEETQTPTGSSGEVLSERLAQYEAFLIKEALHACDGNKAKAARLLGLQPNTLHYKLKRLKLRD